MIKRITLFRALRMIDSIMNDDLLPYQSKEYVKCYLSGSIFRFNGIKPEFPLKGKKIIALSQMTNEKIVCIYLLKYDIKENKIYFLPDHKSINSFVYDKDSYGENDVDEFIDYIKNNYKNASIVLENLELNSKATKYFISCKQSQIINEREAMAINLDSNASYEVYVRSLSKSTRQNIRTAYNRIKADDVKYEFTHYYKEKMPASELRKLMYIQRKRNVEKMGGVKYLGRASKLICWIASFISMSNPRVRFILRYYDSFVDVLSIDGKTAAFVAGYLTRKGRFLIPFLKFNSEFARYSPGGLVICDSIQFLLENVSKFNVYDLLTGCEQYKITYGGHRYITIDLEI